MQEINMLKYQEQLKKGRLSRVLKENGKKCYLGGNIGIPLFTKLNQMDLIIQLF